MKTKRKKILLSGTANKSLAKKIAKEMGLDLGEIKIERFSDEEVRVITREQIEDKEVYLIQTTSAPAAEMIMELLMMADAVKDLKPHKMIAVIPFYGYRRQEKKREDGESLTFALVAKLLKAAGFSKIIVMELHKHRSVKFFREVGLSCRELASFEVIIDYLKKKKLENFVVLAPDKGSTPSSKKYAEALGVPLVQAIKWRDPEKKDQVIFKKFIGKVKGKDVLIIDDEINTAGTLIGVAKILKQKKARNIYFAATHGVLSGPAIERLKKSNLRQVIITDTIYLPAKKKIKKIKVLSVAKIFAEAMK